MDLKTLQSFEAEVRKLVPTLQIRFKDESRVQRWLGAVLRPFNPSYMTTYTSTFGSTVYFPSREYYANRPKNSVMLLSHEAVHILDSRKNPLWFILSYLFPQVFALVLLAVYCTLSWPKMYALLALVGALLVATLAHKSMAIVFVGGILCLAAALVVSFLVSGWLPTLFLLLTFVAAAPWPAPGRVRLEMRGYAMTVALTHWMAGTCPQIVLTGIGRQFYGSPYYYMSWSRRWVENRLQETVDWVTSGRALEEPVYARIHDSLQTLGVIQELGINPCPVNQAPKV